MGKVAVIDYGMGNLHSVGKALEKGLLINAVRPNMIRFMPPLNVSKDEIDQAVKVIDEILEESK